MVQEDHANNWMVVKSPKPPDTLQQWSPAPNPLPVLPEAATDRTFTHENVEPPSAIKDHAMIEPYGMQDARKLDLDDGLEKKAPELAVTAEERNKPADARPTEDATIPRTESTAHAAEDVNIDVMSSRIAVALNDDVSSDLSTDLAMAMYDQHQVVNDAPIIPSESDPSTAERPTTVAEGKKHHSTHPHPTPTETTEGNRVSHKAGIEQIHGQLHGYTKAADRSVSAKRYRAFTQSHTVRCCC